MFQSPQNRGYSSDQNFPAEVFLVCQPVSIPSESGLFLRSDQYLNAALRLLGFNPLRIGAIPQIALVEFFPRGKNFVSIPSESGLFLRFLSADDRRLLNQMFQSPQNRGYSSDWLSLPPPLRLSLVSIPSESGLFLRFGRTFFYPLLSWSFNPLRIGAIPQISL